MTGYLTTLSGSDEGCITSAYSHVVVSILVWGEASQEIMHYQYPLPLTSASHPTYYIANALRLLIY